MVRILFFCTLCAFFLFLWSFAFSISLLQRIVAAFIFLWTWVYVVEGKKKFANKSNKIIFWPDCVDEDCFLVMLLFGLGMSCIEISLYTISE